MSSAVEPFGFPPALVLLVLGQFRGDAIGHSPGFPVSPYFHAVAPGIEPLYAKRRLESVRAPGLCIGMRGYEPGKLLLVQDSLP